MPQAPYGTWESPISAEQLAANSKKFFDTVGDGEFVYNVEMRPEDKARYVIVRYGKDGSVTDMLPAGFSARTSVHEYGGRAFTVHNGTIYFVNWADQFLYKIKAGDEKPTLVHSSGVRFAEPIMTPHGLVAVAENHHTHSDQQPAREPTNFIALIDPVTGDMELIIGGHDFYAFPTVSKDGTKIAWICWDHPNMPWDETQLWVADFIDGTVNNAQRIGADDPTPVSHFQPGWDANNKLVFISDKKDWWNAYRWDAASKAITPVLEIPADMGVPLWNLGLTTWGFYDRYQIFTYVQDGVVVFAFVDPNKPADEPPKFFKSTYNSVQRLCIYNEALYFVGVTATEPAALVRHTIEEGSQILARSADVTLPAGTISVARHIEFPTPSRQKKAYAFYYPPANAEFTGPDGEKPPLIIMIHGGPTGAALRGFDLAKEFWTSRGFAVADVDYGGSTGYGRKYRKALQRDAEDQSGYWGEMDIDDCTACVKYLVEEGLVDPNKVVIRGGSAGGYTTMAAMAKTDIYKAGTSFYGVSDIQLLVKMMRESHKFESRYFDQLIGTLPKFAAVYDERSPIHNLDGIKKAPLLVLQGDEDKIVEPAQAEAVVRALRERGSPVEYVLYPGEQHGFRNKATIAHWHKTEQAFYVKAFYPDMAPEEKKTPTDQALPRPAARA